MSNLPEIQLNETQAPVQDVSNFYLASSGSIGNLVEALAKASLKFEVLTKTASNPFYKSKYADLEAVIKAVRVPLAENGLVVVQAPSTSGKDVVLTTLLAHTSGQWIKSSCSCPCDKFDAQGIGKAISYLRRYSLQALVNLAAEDDDGNEASGKKAVVAVPTYGGYVKPKAGSESEQKTVPVIPSAHGVVDVLKPGANLTGFVATDDDLPDFDAPHVDPLPNSAQSKAIAERLRSFKQDSRKLKDWVEKEAGTSYKEISWKKFQDILTTLTAAEDVGKLIGA